VPGYPPKQPQQQNLLQKILGNDFDLDDIIIPEDLLTKFWRQHKDKEALESYSQLIKKIEKLQELALDLESESVKERIFKQTNTRIKSLQKISTMAFILNPANVFSKLVWLGNKVRGLVSGKMHNDASQLYNNISQKNDIETRLRLDCKEKHNKTSNTIAEKLDITIIILGTIATVFVAIIYGWTIPIIAAACILGTSAVFTAIKLIQDVRSPSLVKKYKEMPEIKTTEILATKIDELVSQTNQITETKDENKLAYVTSDAKKQIQHLDRKCDKLFKEIKVIDKKIINQSTEDLGTKNLEQAVGELSNKADPEQAVDEQEDFMTLHKKYAPPGTTQNAKYRSGEKQVC
jgi:hypothetical protein